MNRALSAASGAAALPRAMQQLQSLAGMIGQTPLLHLTVGFRGQTYTLCAKAESYNLTGSIKDRMAWRILRDAVAGARSTARASRSTFAVACSCSGASTTAPRNHVRTAPTAFTSAAKRDVE